MICTLEIFNNLEDLYKIFKAENLVNDRANCTIKKSKKKLVFKVEAKDIISMKSFLNTILKIIETYEKAK